MIHFSLKNKKYMVLAIIIYLVLWQILALIIENEVIVPSIYIIGKRLIGIILQEDFLLLIFTSLVRTMQALVIALLLASFFSILSYHCRVLYNFIQPILAISKAVPTMAFIVLLLIWVSKEYAPIIIGVIISLPIFYDVILNSILNIDTHILEMCNIYDVTFKDKIKKIILPTVIRAISKVLNSSICLIFKVVISAEVYSQPKYGIGASIQLEKVNLNTSGVIAWMIVILFIAYIFDLTISACDKIIKEKYRC